MTLDCPIATCDWCDEKRRIVRERACPNNPANRPPLPNTVSGGRLFGLAIADGGKIMLLFGKRVWNL